MECKSEKGCFISVEYIKQFELVRLKENENYVKSLNMEVKKIIK